MSTIPRKFLTTSKDGLSSITPLNGQIILIYDSDEVYYDLPANGQRDGAPVRRKVSGVRVVDTLPENPMEGIAYVYVGTEQGKLPESDQYIYDIRVWDEGKWKVVGNNWEDAFVESRVDDSGTFYLVGAPALGTTKGSLRKATDVYVKQDEIYGNLNGNATSATSANNAKHAAVADKATNDNATPPKPITEYVHGITAVTTATDTTLTVSDGAGNSTNIVIPDTTYDIYTADTAGLVNGTDVTVAQDTSDLILCGDGWISTSNITMPAAESAVEDGEGQDIANTYIKDLSYSTSTEELTVTYGDGDTDTVSIPDTTYTVFDASHDGLVPAASNTGDTSKFLKGDHTWATVITSDYQGATAVADGVAGLVPPALAGEMEKYLKGDGTWGTTFAQDAPGLVPGPDATELGNYLRGDGTWAAAVDTLNTAGATNDTTNTLYLVGAQTQSSNPQTYSNAYVYVNGNKLYSYSTTDDASVQVATLSDTQAFTHKTYEGYTLGSACASDVGTTLDVTSASYDADALPKSSVVANYVLDKIGNISASLVSKVEFSTVANEFDDTQTYAVGDFVTYLDDGDDYYKLYRCTNAVTVAGDFSDADWTETTIIDAIKYIIAHP